MNLLKNVKYETKLMKFIGVFLRKDQNSTREFKFCTIINQLKWIKIADKTVREK